MFDIFAKNFYKNALKYKLHHPVQKKKKLPQHKKPYELIQSQRLNRVLNEQNLWL